MNTDAAILETKLYDLLLKKSGEICRNLAWCPAFRPSSIMRRWAEYLEGIGCSKMYIIRSRRGWSRAKYAKSKAPEGTQCIVNPVEPTSFIIIPNDLALKVLALGGFP